MTSVSFYEKIAVVNSFIDHYCINASHSLVPHLGKFSSSSDSPNINTDKWVIVVALVKYDIY